MNPVAENLSYVRHDLAIFADYPLNKILTAGDPEYLKEHYKEIWSLLKIL